MSIVYIIYSDLYMCFSSSFWIYENIREIPTRSGDITENVKNRRTPKIEFLILRFSCFQTDFSGHIGLFTHETTEKSKKYHYFGNLGPKLPKSPKKILNFFSNFDLNFDPLSDVIGKFWLPHFLLPLMLSVEWRWVCIKIPRNDEMAAVSVKKVEIGKFADQWSGPDRTGGPGSPKFCISSTMLLFKWKICKILSV